MNADDPSGQEASLLLAVSLGLGLLALSLAIVSAVFLMKNQGFFEKAHYRSNRIEQDTEVEILDQ